MMADDRNSDQSDSGLGLSGEDRLPWLEAADGFDDDTEVSPARLLVMVLGGLLLIGTVLGGLWWIQNGGARDSKGELITAEKGDYKVAPKTDGAKTFDGEGDASFSASEGAEPAGKVDPTRMPEEPAVPSDRRDMAVKKTEGKAAAKSPASAPATKTAPAAETSGAAVIQLGAFSSDAAASKAWTNLSKRFSYLADLNKSVVPAKVGDATVHRLRVSVGTAANAADLCAKLRVAGENCVVVR